MKTTLIALLLLAAACACGCHSSSSTSPIHFTSLPSSSTGIHFNNQIDENDSLNMFVNEYTYMGGGVGIADFNNDGLPDVFFTGNQVSSRLYLNKGNLKFEDITESAGLTTHAWCTGVSIVDINNDGFPDIYVCVSGKTGGFARHNLLFINNHKLGFTEEAAAYGLADTGYATQAVFFDYDKDGRPDMYLLNHQLDDNRPNDIRDRKVDTLSAAADRLFHNDGIPAGGIHPVFSDATKRAGITEDGNGLGVAVSDFNDDGYPDIYVANDYIRNDLLWLNNGNGTFTNCIASAIQHQSYSSMGTDAADINNDGRPDLITLDMQPETNERKKMMYSFLNDQRHQLEMNKGYEPEYIHNMLQLNNGVRKVNGRQEPFFSEVAEMAGIAETDWSWSVLMADFDNDGWKDIHITNGLGRDPTNIDFLEYRRQSGRQSGLPESDVNQQRSLREHLTQLGPVALHNYLYRNQDGWQFNDLSSAAGIDAPSVSNGAAYADLDNDGDLDLVTSNINNEAFVLRNDAEHAQTGTDSAYYLTIKLNGTKENRDGLGTKLYAYSGGRLQCVEESPVRGYLSSVDQRLHFGFGHQLPDSIKIVWPDAREQLIVHPPHDTLLTLNEESAKAVIIPAVAEAEKFFEDVTVEQGIDFTHAETMFFDYGFQPLIQQKYSQEGPFISVADLNGDGLSDFFVGGAFKQSGKIMLQQSDGRFIGNDLVKTVKNEEDMQSAVFDANGDKLPDLLVASGSTEFDPGSSYYQPRLYINVGNGAFRQDSAAFSLLVRTPAKAVAVADFDGDGDTDVFIGGRVILGTYPSAPRSYLLRNDKGRFTDITREFSPALENPGLINAATWADIDGDHRPELIIAGDWMTPRIFKNNGKQLVEITHEAGLDSLPGMWRSIQAVDIDNDGDIDLVMGNLGLNNPFHIDHDRPAELVAKDFDANGVTEPIFCYYIKDNNGQYHLSTGISRDEWAVQMPVIKKKFDVNSLYAKATMDEILTPDMMENATVLRCNETRSGWFENDGKGRFHFHPFPSAAQIAPVNSIACTDLNNDGLTDIILAGNEYQSQVAAGRYDASYGQVLINRGKGNFDAPGAVATGLVIGGDTRDLKLITIAGKRYLLAAVNNDRLRVFRIR